MNRLHSNRISRARKAFQRNVPAPRSAFTLVEMLVVIAIIGILAALIVGGAGYATSKARISRAQAERDALVTAIQSYHKTMGFYPPDNTNNNTQSSLYYELTGTINKPGVLPTFYSPYTGELLNTGQIPILLGVNGFVNSSTDTNNIYNFAPAFAKASGSAPFKSPGLSGPGTFTLLGVAAPGPVMTNSADSRSINLWHYVSSTPTNNQNSYDLWIDLKYGGKTNRISNWSPDPQAL